MYDHKTNIGNRWVLVQLLRLEDNHIICRNYESGEEIARRPWDVLPAWGPTPQEAL